MPNLPTSPAKNEEGDFDRFDNFMRKLVSVPHTKIKEALDAEKVTKSSSRVPASSGAKA